jgi:hypothetical protein
MILNELPEEILIYIIKFTRNKELKNLALVDKLFFQLTKHNDLMEIIIDTNKDFSRIAYKLKLINHCYKIRRFTDNAVFCKFYLHNYNQLFSNNITQMSLTSCSCSFGKNEIIQLLESNKNITHLTLDIGFNIMDVLYFDIISELKKITHLSLSNSDIVDFTLKESIEKLPRLISLKIIHFPNLYLFDIYIPTLIEISLNRCEYIDSEFLGLFLNKHRQLKKIDFSHMNNNITVSVAIAKWTKNITYLNFSYPDGSVNDLDMALICSHCKELIYIDLSCTFISEKTASVIAIGCKKLKTLLVPYTGMNNNGVITLLKHIPRLHFLDVRFTLVTKDVLKTLKIYPDLSYRIDKMLLYY